MAAHLPKGHAKAAIVALLEKGGDYPSNKAAGIAAGLKRREAFSDALKELVIEGTAVVAEDQSVSIPGLPGVIRANRPTRYKETGVVKTRPCACCGTQFIEERNKPLYDEDGLFVVRGPRLIYRLCSNCRAGYPTPTEDDD